MALLALLLVGASSAASLGDLEVRSRLGEPLDARLALLDAEDTVGVQAALGEDADYAEFGLTRPPIASDLTIAVADGGRSLAIGSRRPVNELVLDLVVVLSGRNEVQVRHYPLLLEFPAEIAAPQTDGLRTTAPPAPRRTPARPEDPSPMALPAAGGSYGPVRPGQTLSGIALELAAGQVDRDWLADAIFALNRDAFVSGNRNRLVAGARLRLPEFGAAGAEGATAPSAEQPRRVPSPDDRLELREPPDPEKLVDVLAEWIERDDAEMVANRDTIARDINFARSEIETFNRENASLRSRITNLESRIASLQRVMALQAELETQAAPAPLAGDQSMRAGVVSASPAAVEAAAAAASAAGDPLPAAAAGPLDEPYVPDYGRYPWFPYLGGLLVCILCGLLFYIRSRDDRERERKKYARFHEMQQEVRSYLPDEL